MLKRLGVMGAVVAVAALAAGSVAPATGHDNDHDHDHGDKLRVLSTNMEEAFVDADPPDFSLGDSFIFTSDLTKRGKDVGHTGVVCTITSVEREESQCVGTVWLHWGQITVQGLVGEEDPIELAITGGTGKFEDAGGTLVVKQLSDDEDEVTVELLTFYFSD